MTDAEFLWRRAEDEMRRTRTLSEATRQEVAGLPLETRVAFAKAITLAGFDATDEPLSSTAVPEVDRLSAARLMLLTMRVDSDAPAWSSWMLDRTLEAVAGLTGGSIGDLFRALYQLLGEHVGALTKPTAGFIKDVVIGGFSRYRESYTSSDWRWLAERVGESPTPAQAYLALLALPPADLSPSAAVGILRSLVNSPYWGNAVAAVEDAVRNDEGRHLLERWLGTGVPSSRVEDVERLLRPSDGP
jgi:hypothetical protein